MTKNPSRQACCPKARSFLDAREPLSRIYSLPGAILAACGALWLLSAAPAQAAPLLEYLDADLEAFVRIRNFLGAAESTDEETATAPQPGLGSTRVDAFRHDPIFGYQFLIPQNPAYEVFAASDVNDEGTFNVGVSGMLNLPGLLEATANYNYAVRNISESNVRMEANYQIPEIEVSLAGLQGQLGQSASVEASYLYRILNADGTESTAGSIYDIFLRATKNLGSVLNNNPLGFVYEWSDDLDALFAEGLPRDVVTSENLLGDFDVESFTVGIYDGRAELPLLLPGQTILFGLSATASLFVPVNAAEYGGQARFGDPFSLSPTGGLSLRIFEDEPVASVPEPSSLWLFGAGLAVFLAFGRRRQGASAGT